MKNAKDKIETMSQSGDPDRKVEKMDPKDEATSESASPRDKKTKLLTTEGETSVPVSRARPLNVQDLLVAGRILTTSKCLFVGCAV